MRRKNVFYVDVSNIDLEEYVSISNIVVKRWR